MTSRIYPVLILAGCLAVTACSGKKTKPAAGPAVVDDTAASGSMQNGNGGTSTSPLGTYSPADLERDSCLRNRVVYFDLDSDITKPEFQAAIGCHAKYLRDRPAARLKLDGHTDERGSNEYNLALGERRAKSVRQAMSAMGASSGQIEFASFGEEAPTCRTPDESCWSKNRRVEINYLAQ